MFFRVRAGWVTLACVVSALGGCTTPNAANIELRRQVQSLQDENETLKRLHAGDEASLKARESTTTPATGVGELDTLFTTHGIRFGRLTGGADLDTSKPGEDGLKVSVIPFDEDHDDIKAAGAITIEAFDLADSDTRLGQWEFSAAQTREFWNGNGLLYEYIVPCPWQTPPKHAEITIRVTFVDTLTGRSFSEQKVVKVKLAENRQSRLIYFHRYRFCSVEKHYLSEVD